jgi:hypothetical protein
VVMKMSGPGGSVEKTDCGCESQVDRESGGIAYFMVNGELKPLDLRGANPPFSARITGRKPLD